MQRTRTPFSSSAPHPELWPLRPDTDVDAIVAWDRHEAIRAAQFLADVAGAAERLPECRYLINLCEDRYRFLVAFAAALARGIVSLLPHNKTADALAQLRHHYPDLACISDSPISFAAGEVLDGNMLLASPSRDGALKTVPGCAPDDIAAIVFTSGSTGTPKGHAKTWRSMVEIARRTGERFGIGAAFRPSVVATVPQQHMYGLETSILLPLQQGLAFARGKPFYPEDIRMVLESVPPPRMLVTTPVHLRACVHEAVTFPELALIVSATAPLSIDLAARAEAQFGAPVHEIYGWSEAGSVATRRTCNEPIWRVFDGSSVALNGQTRQYELHAPHSAAPVPFDDVVRPESETTFHLLGRGQDMINIAGKRASLAALNLALTSLPGIIDGVFYAPTGADDAVTRLAAFVVAPQVTAHAVTRQLRTSVDPVFLPRPIVFVEQLPRDASGKLPRAGLDALWRTYQERKKFPA